MRTWRGAGRLAIVMAALVALCVPASAAQKLAVFPFDMQFPSAEEDFFTGPKGPNDAERNRLALAQAELEKAFGADSRYQVMDLKPMAAELTAAQPFYACNGCEIDLAGKAKADIVVTSVVEKISETHLSLTVALIDVANSKLIRNASVLIQGNTDDSWLHGVRWLTKNRLLAEDKPR
jgi:hypothetical protein